MVIDCVYLQYTIQVSLLSNNYSTKIKKQTEHIPWLMRLGVWLIQKHCLDMLYLAPSNLKITTHLFACRQRKCFKWHQMSTQNSPQAQNNIFNKIIILGTFSYKNTEQMTEKVNIQRACYWKSHKQNIT